MCEAALQWRAFDRKLTRHSVWRVRRGPIFTSKHGHAAWCNPVQQANGWGLPDDRAPVEVQAWRSRGHRGGERSNSWMILNPCRELWTPAREDDDHTLCVKSLKIQNWYCNHLFAGSRYSTWWGSLRNTFSHYYQTKCNGDIMMNFDNFVCPKTWHGAKQMAWKNVWGEVQGIP